MRLHLFHLGLLWSVLLFAEGLACAQTPPTQSLAAPLPQGGVVVFRLKTTPLGANTRAAESESDLRLPLTPQVLAGAGNVFHRWLMDEKGNLVFGYDLLVEPLAGTNRFKVSARPLDHQFEARFPAGGTGALSERTEMPLALSTLPRATEDQIISDGETFALDMLVNEQLGLKVVDFIRVTTERQRVPAPGVVPSPRDFTVTNVELSIKNYQLMIDGETLRTASARRSCTGALVWFALPEGGRFIFSLAPHEGYDFRKLGVIENNKIAFTWKGARYEWISDAPIVGSGGSWNLWVLHDPSYVDPFAAPVNIAAQESKLARMLRDPLGKLSEPDGGDRRNSLQTGFAQKFRWADEIFDLHEFGSPISYGRFELPGNALKMKERRNVAAAARRVRVLIGSANSIESLLPKK